MAEGMLQVEVAYARPDRQQIIPLQVPEGTTLFEAARQSGITRVFPEIDLEHSDMGVFGQLVPNPKEQPLRDGDRVGIYRPLKIDPKAARRDRARKGKKGQ